MPDLAPWTTGVGACMLEALQRDLTARWVQVERRKDRITEYDDMRALGQAQERVLTVFLDAVEKPEDVWHLTNFIVSLGPDRPVFSTLITVTSVKDAIPDDPNAEFWKKVSPGYQVFGTMIPPVLVEPTALTKAAPWSGPDASTRICGLYLSWMKS